MQRIDKTPMLNIIYTLVQFTWGFLQSIAGAVIFLKNIRCKHFVYHGAIVTEWRSPTSVSLGIFVFVTDKPYFYDKVKDVIPENEIESRILVHEYGHTIQSLMLGPLYLFVIGIPSTVWAFIPSLVKKRHEKQISYFALYPERWANYLGEKVTGDSSPGSIVID